MEKLMVRNDMAADLVTTPEEATNSLLEEYMSRGVVNVCSILEGSKSGRVKKITITLPYANHHLDVVWKERPHGRVKRMRKENIPSGTEWKRERLVYLVSSIFELRNVPPTVIRKVDGVLGSAQAFIPDTQTWKDSGMTYEDIPVEEWQRLALLDWVCCNTDRHSRNWLVSRNADKTLWAIDNGLCFPDRTEYGLFRGYRSRPHQMLSEHGDLELPDSVTCGITAEGISAIREELVRFGVAKEGRIIFLCRLNYVRKYRSLPEYRDAGKGFMRSL